MCGWVYDKGKMKLRNNEDGNNKEKTDQLQDEGVKWVLVWEKLSMLRIEVKRVVLGFGIMVLFDITWFLNGEFSLEDELDQVPTGIEDEFMIFKGCGAVWYEDESLPPVKDFTPRGLINARNLCFLNATLQALLSCALFVPLLQGLQLQDIPKAESPTLAAFSEIIS